MHTSRIPFRTAADEPYGILVINREVTDLKQAEALAQHRADQMTIAAEIARDTTGTLEVKPLLQKAVTLVRDRFGFYHASIFLIDPAGEYAVLRESTGEAGQQMLLSGHRLAVGSRSIVGQVTASGEALIVNNVHQDPTHFPNPLLPDTKSELAIPLKVGERVLGALDVQSTQVDAFNAEEDLSVLQILADQLAVAVVNGELFAKTQELLGKHRLLRQISIGASSSSNLDDALFNIVSGLHTAKVSDHIAILLLNNEGLFQVRASAGYEGTRHLELRIALGQGITGQAAADKRAVRVEDTQLDPRYLNIDSEIRSELAIPILFNDELLGVLNLESKNVAAFDENDQEILGALGNNIGAIVANIRLVTQVRQQVSRERQLFDATSKIRRSVDLETILQTSAQEICLALGAQRAKIRITAGTGEAEITPPRPGSGGNGHKNGSGSNGREGSK
jgi:GAF domain-containing protein